MKTIFVSCLPFKITKDELKYIFEKYGKVNSIELFADWRDTTFEPYAHITMENSEEVIKELDGRQIGLNYLRVNELPKRKIEELR